MTYAARTVSIDDPDLGRILDDVYMLCVDNMRPWLACSSPPHPARPQLDRMMVQDDPPLTLVVVEDEDTGELMAWDVHSPEGVILGGMIRHSPEHQGYVAHFDERATLLQSLMNAQIRANTGGQVFHVGFGNQTVWYGLEVHLGIPRDPAAGRDDPAPTGWPEYTGPPSP